MAPVEISARQLYNVGSDFIEMDEQELRIDRRSHEARTWTGCLANDTDINASLLCILYDRKIAVDRVDWDSMGLELREKSQFVNAEHTRLGSIP